MKNLKNQFQVWFVVVLLAALLFGYGRCIFKVLTCNWEPVGKAEVVYTFGIVTGTGCIIGYFNIEDK